MKESVTEEMISALVDGELSPDEARHVKEAVLADPASRQLYEKVTKLNKVFELSHERIQQSESVERLAVRPSDEVEQLMVVRLKVLSATYEYSCRAIDWSFGGCVYNSASQQT